MAKKKTASGRALAAGTQIRVRPGVAAPEFPAVPCEGWTGRIADMTGKKDDPRYVIEWDDETLRRMPADYVQQCEQRQLFYRMACLRPDEIEAVEA